MHTSPRGIPREKSSSRCDDQGLAGQQTGYPNIGQQRHPHRISDPGHAGRASGFGGGYQHIQPEVVAGRIIDAVLKGKPGRHPLYEVLDLAACPKG